MFLPQLATYVSFILVIIAYTLKVIKVARMPLHLRWELYPVAHEKGYKYGGSYCEELEWWTKPIQRNVARSVLLKLRDYLSFSEYFHRKRGYWFGLFPWHIGFYLLMGFQALSFLGALLILTAGLSVSAESANILGKILYHLSLVVAVGGFVAGSIGSIVLLVRRLTDADLRAYSSAMDYFNYLFFLALFLSGLFVWFADPTLFAYREFWKSLITFSYIDIEPALYVFVMLFALHLIHLPFTRSTHYITKFFAFFGVLWDDTPNFRGSDVGKKVEKALAKPVSWAAPHIQSGKSWGENARGLPENKTGEKEE